jgi:thiol-disulfide isomerase/thioredoxin
MNSRSDPGFAGIRQHLDSAYAEIINRQRLYMEKFIDQHSASLASLIVLNRKFGPNFIFTEEKDARYFIKVDSCLMAKYPGNKHAVDHHSRVAAMIKKQNQRLSNAEGIPVSLSSLKGKVVLVYFWAAMDGQSRKFIRQLIPIYKANRNKGFEIYGIALESNKALWLNAIKLDQPGGIQVLADGGTENPVAALFGVESLPEAILVGRQGKIIERRISLNKLRRNIPVPLQLK